MIKQDRYVQSNSRSANVCVCISFWRHPEPIDHKFSRVLSIYSLCANNKQHQFIFTFINNILHKFIHSFSKQTKMTKTKNPKPKKTLGGNCGHPSGNIHDIFVRMVVAQRIRYETVITNGHSNAISFLIIPNILVSMGRAVPSRCACWFAKRIYRSIHDQCLGYVCCRLFGHIHCQPSSLHDNSVVGLNYTIFS